jgi:serine/threonine protein kinase
LQFQSRKFTVHLDESKADRTRALRTTRRFDDRLSRRSFILFELCGDSTVQAYLKAERDMRRFVNQNYLVQWGYQMCSALALMRAANFVHSDVAARNIFFPRDPTDQKEHRVLVGDLGLGATVGADGLFAYHYQSRSSAPEILGGQNIFHPADMWGVGMILACGMLREDPEGRPLATQPDVQAFAQRVMDLPADAGYTLPFKQLVRDLLSFAPDQRPTADAALARLKSINRTDSKPLPQRFG